MTMHAHTDSPSATQCAHASHCPRPVRLEVLARTPLFHGMGDILSNVEKRMRAQAWATGEYLYMEGDRAHDLFVLASGSAKVIKTTVDGVETIFEILGPGDLFGGLSNLGIAHYSESVQTLEPTCALRIGSSDFRRLLADYPQVAVRAFDEVTTQLLDARGIFKKTSTGTVRERVAYALLRLAGKFGEQQSTALVIHVPLSRSEIAAMTGSTTESVSRVMSQMRRDGIIGPGRKQISIVKLSQLQELAQEFTLD
ncbi:MAG: Crp/Fnr family transcriptional regulator [Actinomycetaceae bacterium]|nr:Crp/Fnr family transcriptional regulator [Actinomycetaceae bacterium]